MTRLVFVFIFLFLLVMAILVKKGVANQKAMIENLQRREKEMEEREAEENRKKEETIKRITSNDTVRSWVEEIANTIETIITQSPHNDYEFQFRSYTYGFLFGIEIQDIYLQGIKEKIKSENYKPLEAWDFSECNLPELKKEQLTLFDKAVAEMTVAILSEKGVDLEIQPRWRVINRQGWGISDYYGNSHMYAAIYKRKTVDGEW